MADGGLGIPNNTNWSEWSFGQVLLAITGDSIDFKKALDVDWFKFSTSGGSASDDVSYHAWQKYYYGASYNYQAISDWQDLVTRMNTIAQDLYLNRRGTLDLWSLRDAQVKVKQYEGWLQSSGQDYRAWAKNLNSHDSAFRGKAAAVIQLRMDQNADKLEDLYHQLSTNNGLPASAAMKSAQDAMDQATRILADAWYSVANSNLLNIPVDMINAKSSEISNYLADTTNGGSIIAGTEWYVLDSYAFGDDRQDALDIIDKKLAGFKDGNLISQNTWTNINHAISKAVQDKLDHLDQEARRAIGQLYPALVTATTAMVELQAPKFSQPPPGGFVDPKDKGPGDGPDKPPPLDIPPPDINIPPPNINIPPPPDIKPPPDPANGGAGGGPDAGLGNGPGSGPDGGLGGPDGGPQTFFKSVGPAGQLRTRLAEGLPPGADGGLLGDRVPADGGLSGGGLPADGLPAGSPADGGTGGPGLVPGMLRRRAVARGLDANGNPLPGFDSKGNPLPGFDASGQPLPGFDANGHPLPGFDSMGNPLPGFDASGNPLPGFDSHGHPLPGFDANGDPLPGAGSQRHLLPGLASHSHGFSGAGVGGHPLAGFDSHGHPLPGSGGGAGAGVHGSAAASGLEFGSSSGTTAPVGGSGTGGSGRDGAPGFGPGAFGLPPLSGTQLSGPAGAGGMPMMPPMMGGMGGAGGNDQKERERTTWLSEDEEVWGVNQPAGMSVVGRPDEDDYDIDESLVAAGPVRGPRRPAKDRPQPDHRDAERTAAGQNLPG
jgi:hypothetical protein